MRFLVAFLAVLVVSGCGKSQQQLEQEGFDKYQRVAQERRKRHEAADKAMMDAYDKAEAEKKAAKAAEKKASTE